jgi:hypothetical protein
MNDSASEAMTGLATFPNLLRGSGCSTNGNVREREVVITTRGSGGCSATPPLRTGLDPGLVRVCCRDPRGNAYGELQCNPSTGASGHRCTGLGVRRQDVLHSILRMKTGGIRIDRF